MDPLICWIWSLISVISARLSACPLRSDLIASEVLFVGFFNLLAETCNFTLYADRSQLDAGDLIIGLLNLMVQIAAKPPKIIRRGTSGHGQDGDENQDGQMSLQYLSFCGHGPPGLCALAAIESSNPVSPAHRRDSQDHYSFGQVKPQ